MRPYFLALGILLGSTVLLIFMVAAGSVLSAVAVALCVLGPFLLMWWMISARRRVREALSARHTQEARDEQSYVDELARADGFALARTFDVNHQLIDVTRGDEELPGIKAIQGRR